MKDIIKQLSNLLSDDKQYSYLDIYIFRIKGNGRTKKPRANPTFKKTSLPSCSAVNMLVISSHNIKVYPFLGIYHILRGLYKRNKIEIPYKLGRCPKDRGFFHSYKFNKPFALLDKFFIRRIRG